MASPPRGRPLAAVAAHDAEDDFNDDVENVDKVLRDNRLRCFEDGQILRLFAS